MEGSVNKLASAVYSSVVAGLQGFEATQNLPILLIEDEAVETRMNIILKHYLAGKLPLKDLYFSINCIPLECRPIDNCYLDCGEGDEFDEKIPSFEIPQIFTFDSNDAIGWAGSTDKQIKFKVYTSPSFRFHKYRMRGKNKPYIYIDTTPNKNNMYTGYVFNAPMLEQISISAIFKDPRQLEQFSCCGDTLEKENLTGITTEIKDTLVRKYVTYYRLYQLQPVQNDQEPR